MKCFFSARDSVVVLLPMKVAAMTLGIDFGKYGNYSYNGGSRFRTENFILIP
jgi:hypothetical protein